MVLSVFVMRMAGEEEGGIFSFGFSTLGQQLFIVAYFGIRPFQITDGKGNIPLAIICAIEGSPVWRLWQGAALSWGSCGHAGAL